MKLNKQTILPVIAACVIAGCGTERKAITSEPSNCVVTPTDEGYADLDVDFKIPGHYFSKRSRLFITPTVVVGDSVVGEYEPLVLDASIYRKKTRRKEVLHGYVDPYAEQVVAYGPLSKPGVVHYNDSIEVTEDADRGRILAVISNDGCGQCTGVDTIEVATISYPPVVIDPANLLKDAWITPEFVVREKVHHGKGESRLQFVVDKWDIVMDMADNRAELTNMLNTLRPILSDSLTTVTSLNIFGSASAEASYKHNVMLANNRANAAKNWLSAELNLPRKVRDIIRVGAAPEGWEPVVQAMIAANDPDSTLVRELMIKYPGPTDDAAEKYIRRLACWPRIRQNYLAKDRKVIYDYSWTVKSFTNDKEMIEIFSTRPDALNEEEFLHVAELAKDNSSRLQVYEELLKYFPESATGISNLAYLYVAAGNHDKAIALLAPVADKTDRMRMIMASALLERGQDGEAMELLEGLDNTDAAETIELIKKKQRRKK